MFSSDLNLIRGSKTCPVKFGRPSHDAEREPSTAALPSQYSLGHHFVNTPKRRVYRDIYIYTYTYIDVHIHIYDMIVSLMLNVFSI